jgi:hypothetical protein
VGVTDLMHESFAPFVSTHRFAVVHFWALWNGYDVGMKHLLEQRLPADLRSQIEFGRLDVDTPENLEICVRHSVSNVPFLAFYRDGVLVETITGSCEERVIVEHLRRLVA